MNEKHYKNIKMERTLKLMTPHQSQKQTPEADGGLCPKGRAPWPAEGGGLTPAPGLATTRVSFQLGSCYSLASTL